jgi:hypothetical protein
MFLRNGHLQRQNERAQGLFERSILRSIAGLVQDKGQWRRNRKFELYTLFETSLAKYFKSNKFKMAGHVIQTDNNRQ